MTSQILEGTSCIPVTLFEPVAELDADPIYLQKKIQFKGHELADEWCALQAQATLELRIAFFGRHQEVVAAAQSHFSELRRYRRR